MPLQVMLTGANGFIGRRLASLLVEQGNDVVGLSRVEADVTDHRALLSQARPVDALVHLAFPTRASQRRGAPMEALRAVASGAGNLVALAVSCGARHLVLASSGKVYGEPGILPTREEHPRNPNTFLGELKVLQESVLELAARRSDATLGVTSLRLFNVFGPGQPAEFVISHLLEGMRRGGPIALGELDHARDYLYLDDACSAFAVALGSPPPLGEFRPLNVGTSRSASVREILGIFARISGREPRIVMEPLRARPEEAAEEIADIGRLRALGWAPLVTLEDGLRSLWEGGQEGLDNKLAK